MLKSFEIEKKTYVHAAARHMWTLRDEFHEFRI